MRQNKSAVTNNITIVLNDRLPIHQRHHHHRPTALLQMHPDRFTNRSWSSVRVSSFVNTQRARLKPSRNDIEIEINGVTARYSRRPRVTVQEDPTVQHRRDAFYCPRHKQTRRERSQPLGFVLASQCGPCILPSSLFSLNHLNDTIPQGAMMMMGL